VCLKPPRPSATPPWEGNTQVVKDTAPYTNEVQGRQTKIPLCGGVAEGRGGENGRSLAALPSSPKAEVIGKKGV